MGGGEERRAEPPPPTVYVGKTGNRESAGRLRDPRRTQSIDSDVGGSLATSIDRHYIGKGQADQFVAALLASLLLVTLPRYLFRVLFTFPLFIFSRYTSARSIFALIQLSDYNRRGM